MCFCVAWLRLPLSAQKCRKRILMVRSAAIEYGKHVCDSTLDVKHRLASNGSVRRLIAFMFIFIKIAFMQLKKVELLAHLSLLASLIFKNCAASFAMTLQCSKRNWSHCNFTYTCKGYFSTVERLENERLHMPITSQQPFKFYAISELEITSIKLGVQVLVLYSNEPMLRCRIVVSMERNSRNSWGKGEIFLFL